MTTGEDVVVTWANAQATLDAWMQAEYYATGTAESLINSFGGNGDSLDVETVPDRGANRDDFCEKLRYYYGSCINLSQSRAMDPKKYNEAQMKGQTGPAK